LPGEVPAGFVGLLEEGDPLALAILARLFALLKYIEELWWLKVPSLKSEDWLGW
jgi:hypothetical protein